jgi:hypothetical protein
MISVEVGFQDSLPGAGLHGNNTHIASDKILVGLVAATSRHSYGSRNPGSGPWTAIRGDGVSLAHRTYFCHLVPRLRLGTHTFRALPGKAAYFNEQGRRSLPVCIPRQSLGTNGVAATWHNSAQTLTFETPSSLCPASGRDEPRPDAGPLNDNRTYLLVPAICRHRMRSLAAITGREPGP